MLVRSLLALLLLLRGRGDHRRECFADGWIFKHLTERPSNDEVRQLEVTPPRRVGVVLEGAGAQHRARRGQRARVRGDARGGVRLLLTEVQAGQRRRESDKLEDAHEHLSHPLLLVVVLVGLAVVWTSSHVVHVSVHVCVQPVVVRASVRGVRLIVAGLIQIAIGAEDSTPHLLLLLLLLDAEHAALGLLPVRRRRGAGDREGRSVRATGARLLGPIETAESARALTLTLTLERVISKGAERVNLDGRHTPRALVRVVDSLLQRSRRGLDDTRVGLRALRARRGRSHRGHRGECNGRSRG